MNNTEIIYREALEQGIFSQDELDRRILQDEDLGLKTCRSWNALNRKIKKGQKALLKTRLWQRKLVKADEHSEPAETFVKVPAYLFDASQTEPLED